MSFHIQKVKGQLRSYFIMFLWLIKVNMSSMGFSSKQLQMIFVALRQVFQRIVLCLTSPRQQDAGWKWVAAAWFSISICPVQWTDVPLLTPNSNFEVICQKTWNMSPGKHCLLTMRFADLYSEVQLFKSPFFSPGLFFLLFFNCCDVNTLSKYVMNKIPHSFSHYLLVPFLFTTQGAWFWPKQHCSLWNELSVLYWWLEEELSNVKNSDKQPTVAL